MRVSARLPCQPAIGARERNHGDVYLFIKLLRAANAADTVDRLKALDLSGCKFANVVVLAEDKLVAQLDCETSTEANTAILEKISPVETNIVAAVRPVHK